MTERIRIIILDTHGTQIWTQSAKIDLRLILELNCNNNYRTRTSELVLAYSIKPIRALSGNPGKVLRN